MDGHGLYADTIWLSYFIIITTTTVMDSWSPVVKTIYIVFAEFFVGRQDFDLLRRCEFNSNFTSLPCYLAVDFLAEIAM